MPRFSVVESWYWPLSQRLLPAESPAVVQPGQKKAFDENGIKFSFPTVSVTGEGAKPPPPPSRTALSS